MQFSCNIHTFFFKFPEYIARYYHAIALLIFKLHKVTLIHNKGVPMQYTYFFFENSQNILSGTTTKSYC